MKHVSLDSRLYSGGFGSNEVRVIMEVFTKIIPTIGGLNFLLFQIHTHNQKRLIIPCNIMYH